MTAAAYTAPQPVDRAALDLAVMAHRHQAHWPVHVDFYEDANTVGVRVRDAAERDTWARLLDLVTDEYMGADGRLRTTAYGTWHGWKITLYAVSQSAATAVAALPVDPGGPGCADGCACDSAARRVAGLRTATDLHDMPTGDQANHATAEALRTAEDLHVRLPVLYDDSVHEGHALIPQRVLDRVDPVASYPAPRRAAELALADAMAEAARAKGDRAVLTADLDAMRAQRARLGDMLHGEASGGAA